MSTNVLTFQTLRDAGTEGLLMKALLFGDSGSGKTHTSVTAPNPCVLLTEPNGVLSIKASNPDAYVVDVMRMAAETNQKPMDIVRQFFKAAMDGTLKAQTKAETIVIDSLTELQRMLQDEILDQKSQGGKIQAQWTLQDWSILTDRMRKLVRIIRDLPFNVVATALAQTETDGQENRYVLPSFQGKKLPNEVAGYFSLVGYVFRQREKDDDGDEVVKHKVLLSGPSTYLTKNVAPLLAVEDPNISDWLQKIKANSAVDLTPKKVGKVESKNTTKRGRTRTSRLSR
jgi:hypothetical protein